MRDTLEGRFYYSETPILYEIMQDEKRLEDQKGFKTVLIPYKDNFPQILMDLRLSPVDAVYTDVQDETFLNMIKDMGIILYTTHPMKGGRKVKRFGKKVWTAGGYRHNAVSESMKWCLDRMGGIVGTMIFIMLYVIVGPMIKLDSKGPIVFKQERIGLNGRRFIVYKFRTMRQDADEQREAMKEAKGANTIDALMFKDENDARITKIGKFLRKNSLDEFPQFLNVLKGEMSVVGTRPPTVDEFVLYKPTYKKRLAVKPGVTGVWQTSGRNQIRDFNEVIDMDMSYIKNGGVMRYISLVLKTIPLCREGDGV